MNKTYTEYLLQPANPTSDRSIGFGKQDTYSPFRHHLSEATVAAQIDRHQNVESKLAKTSVKVPDESLNERTAQHVQSTTGDILQNYERVESEVEDDGKQEKQVSVTSTGEEASLQSVPARMDIAVNTEELPETLLHQCVSEVVELTLEEISGPEFQENTRVEASRQTISSEKSTGQLHASDTVLGSSANAELPIDSSLLNNSHTDLGERITMELGGETTVGAIQTVDGNSKPYNPSEASAVAATHSKQEANTTKNSAETSNASPNTVDSRRRLDERVKIRSFVESEEAAILHAKESIAGSSLVATQVTQDSSGVVNAGEQTPEQAERSESKADSLVALLGRSHELTGGSRRIRSVGGHNDLPVVDVNRFIGRVAKAFHTANERGGALQIRLSPPELGSLRLELTIHDGVMSAALETETVLARRVLLDHLPALRERLAEQNIRIERFDVDVREQSYRGQSDGHGKYQPQERHSYQTVTRANIPGLPESESAVSHMPNVSVQISNLSINLVV